MIRVSKVSPTTSPLVLDALILTFTWPGKALSSAEISRFTLVDVPFSINIEGIALPNSSWNVPDHNSSLKVEVN